jgi:hypothetical protein
VRPTQPSKHWVPGQASGPKQAPIQWVPRLAVEPK